ncbi:MAG TPA: PEP-CTERM sorting domain-containing protein [Gammaproteobacteria bacterium]|nr:PEP-CTERM sorting domain-containing protein [Gammaproteobacteria bacterium]
MLPFLGAVATSPAHALGVTTSSDASALAGAILGSGINIVGTPSYTGVAGQSGTFTGGLAAGIGFDTGIVLTSGSALEVPGPNISDPETVGIPTLDNGNFTSVQLGTAGDTDLNNLVNNETFDAAVLEFDFQFGDGSTGGDLFFNFAFGSEEYVDFIDSEFNDVFGFFLDGVNIGVVPGTDTPVSVNTINNSVNADLYRNNVDNTDGIPNLGIDVSYDGLTTVLTAQATGLTAGTHRIKLAIADTSDAILDAGVFIQGGTFSSVPTPTPTVPVPPALWLFGSGLAGLYGATRRKRAMS